MALYPRLEKLAGKTLDIPNLTGTLFSMAVYHDLGYLFKIDNININNTIRELLLNDNDIKDVEQNIKDINLDHTQHLPYG